MHNARVIILVLVFTIYGSFNAYPQCMGFHKSSRCLVSEAKEFKQYSQAKSAAIEVGQLYKFKAVLYGKKDYIFSVCAEQGFKPVHFRIVDIAKDEVIYDNVEDNYNQSIGFSVENTTTVNVEVEILNEEGEKNKDPQKYRVCIGVQIWWRKIPKLGFE